MTRSIRSDSVEECREWAKVLEYHSGRLPESEFESIVDHINICPGCDKRLENLKVSLSDDGLDQRIRSCANAGELLSREIGLLTADLGSPPLPNTVDYSQSLTVVAEDVPKSIGFYDVDKIVGRGGMGIVYRGREHLLKRFVAIKMVRAGTFAGAPAIQRFFKEIEAVSRIRHPNLVQLYHAGKHHKLPYFAMEWIDGESLAAKLSRGCLPIREAAEIVRTLADAMAFAHESNVIHRDLKPSNILLTADGTPKIVDFGLAKLLDDGGDETVSEMILGTPSYMAPEQAAGNRSEVGRLTDVYALGAILYESLTGRPPFQGRSKLETMQMVRETDVTPPRKIRPEIPRDLEEICLKCLEKMPARRYPFARALAGDLTRWLEGKRVQHTPGWFTRLGRAARKNAKVTAAAIVVMAALVATSFALQPSKQPFDDYDPSTSNYKHELVQGQTTTLIGETGKPKVFRWRAGEFSGKTTLAPDGTFRVHAQDTCLLELVPDPGSNHFRFEAKVRQDKSNPGSVGIYFGDQTFRSGEQEIHCFLRATFNAFGSSRQSQILANQNLPQVPSKLVISLDLSWENGSQQWLGDTWSLEAGPSITPVDKYKQQWHDLTVTVSPTGIETKWDGQQFHVPASQIVGAIPKLVKMTSRRHPVVGEVEPKFNARAALGLYVDHGSASFHSVSITPLPNLAK